MTLTRRKGSRRWRNPNPNRNPNHNPNPNPNPSKGLTALGEALATSVGPLGLLLGDAVQGAIVAGAAQATP